MLKAHARLCKYVIFIMYVLYDVLKEDSEDTTARSSNLSEAEQHRLVNKLMNLHLKIN